VRNSIAGPADPITGKQDTSSLRIKVIAAAITGAIAIFFANPFVSVTLVILQSVTSDSHVLIYCRQGYSH
jgi:hypothetical protein